MINDKFITYRNSLSNEVDRFWSDYEIVNVLTGQVYSLSKGFHPREPQTVVDEFVAKFRASAEVRMITSDHYAYYGTLTNLMDLLKRVLFSCPSYKRMNLTDEEFESGVDPDNDEERKKFSASGKNFIDLDAIFQNICYQLTKELVYDDLCECRIFQGD